MRGTRITNGSNGKIKSSQQGKETQETQEAEAAGRAHLGLLFLNVTRTIFVSSGLSHVASSAHPTLHIMLLWSLFLDVHNPLLDDGLPYDRVGHSDFLSDHGRLWLSIDNLGLSVHSRCSILDIGLGDVLSGRSIHLGLLVGHLLERRLWDNSGLEGQPVLLRRIVRRKGSIVLEGGLLSGVGRSGVGRGEVSGWGALEGALRVVEGGAVGGVGREASGAGLGNHDIQRM